MLAAVIVPAGFQTAPPPAAEAVRIALVPGNPQRIPEPATPTDSEQSPAPLPEAAPAEPPAATPEPEPEPDVGPSSTLAETSPPEQTRPPPPVVSVPTVDLPDVELPDSRAIRQSLQQLQQARGSRLTQFDCDERQRRSDLMDCGDDIDARDYEALESNATYRALNPLRATSRSQRTVSTVARNATGLAARLRASDVDPQVQEYVLQELEAGISEHGNTRQSSVETIIRMTDQSAAAQQAREILGDPWVIQRYREMRQRRVTVDP